MPLSRFTFIVKAPGYSPEAHRAVLSSAQFTTVIIGVPDLPCAILVANEQVRSGTQLIELCGGFTQVEVGQLRAQLPVPVPVGVVAYTAEQEAEMARLFG
ncbi:MAG: DUF6506 family protein [Rubrivivax sp.]